MLTPSELAKFCGQPWRKHRNYRPAPNGDQRDEHYPNVRWADIYGIVHQASAHCNLTLCELDKRFERLLHHEIFKATPARITCIGCMGYETWPEYPVE